jgi:hypothetical protein
MGLHSEDSEQNPKQMKFHQGEEWHKNCHSDILMMMMFDARSGRVPPSFRLFNLGLLALLLLIGRSGSLAQVIIADNYNITGSGTGFALGSGINSGINPPTTRLSGSAFANLRYINTATKPETAFGIAGSKLRVTSAASPGRFTLSENGTSAFNFAPALGVTGATAANPSVYDLSISMANNSAGTQRFSFAIGTVEGDAFAWDFGIQLYRAGSSDGFYTIGKRIDTGSSGLASDINAPITASASYVYGTEMNFLIRVTDAGAESTTFKSRVQISLDKGLTWIYDTATDAALPNGWRFDGGARCVMWDVAPDAGNVTYDNFGIRLAPLAARLIAPQQNTPNIGASPLLTAAVSNKAPENVTVQFYGREAPSDLPGRDFCIAVLPDTQNYAREAAGHGVATKEMWISQTEWVVTNRVAHNIAYLAHLGDIVQSGDIKNGNSNLAEWRNATNAMYRLENPSRTGLPQGIPYGLAVGNHDQEPIGEEDGTTTMYNKYFGVSRFSQREYFGGNYGDNNDNHFDLFSISGLDFIVFYFEFGRYGSGVLNWANAVLATNQHRRAFAVTHFVGQDGSPINHSAQGAALYNGLKGNTNFFMMLGGHVFNEGGEGSRVDTYQGRTVRTFVSDYQGRMNGGNGWMRLIYFSPSNNLVTVKTFSPWLNQWETDANSQMSFTYNMRGALVPGNVSQPFALLETLTNVAPASVVGIAFPALQPSTQYEWHVKVTDRLGNVVYSPIGRFATAINSPPSVQNQSVGVFGDRPSVLNLPASDANNDVLSFWTTATPLHGMVTDIDSVSRKLTYLPVRGYQGSDFVQFRASDGISESPAGTVLLNIVAPVDANTNNLPDYWEEMYGVSVPDTDSDGDGQSDYAEYLAGTNPTNSASSLKLLSAEHVADENYFGMTWPSIGGTRYRVQVRDGDVGGDFMDLPRDISDEMDSNPYGTESIQYFEDHTIQSSTNNRYYRVRIVQ